MAVELMTGGGYPWVPVGGIIEFDPTGLSNAPNMSTADLVASVMGYGKWEAYGAGRVVVGAGDGYSAGATGGEKTHTLTQGEMPSHEHTYAPRVNWVDIKTTVNAMKSEGAENGSHLAIDSGVFSHTNYTGSSQSHNNMQPYVVAYKWRRIA